MNAREVAEMADIKRLTNGSVYETGLGLVYAGETSKYGARRYGEPHRLNTHGVPPRCDKNGGAKK